MMAMISYNDEEIEFVVVVMMEGEGGCGSGIVTIIKVFVEWLGGGNHSLKISLGRVNPEIV